MSIPPDLSALIVSDPDVLGGTPCFAGTRVPLETFLDYVEEGYSLDRFIQGFSSVHRDQAATVLEWQSRQSREAIGLLPA